MKFRKPMPIGRDPDPLSPSKVRKDLFAALKEEPFPIRGWHLGMSFATGNKYAYPVYTTGDVEKDEDGIPKEKPPVLFYVESAELVLTADFRLEACKTLGGQPWKCPQQAIDQQWIRFANTNGSLELILDTKYVPPYQERLVYPKHDEWMSHVEHWVKKWEDSRKKDHLARWVLVQLDGIRNSANSILRESLGRLVERIQKEVPDYWLLAEVAMAGRLTDEEIEAVMAHPVGKGAITIRTFQRPTGAPTEKVQ